MNNRYKLNCELAQMLKGGVIMDVTTPEQAKIAEKAIFEETVAWIIRNKDLKVTADDQKVNLYVF